MNGFEDQDKVLNAWNVQFKQCTDFDLWGQPIEAIEGYQRLAKQLQEFSSLDVHIFTDEQKKVLGKISVCLNLRCKALQNPGGIEGIHLEDLKRIGATLKIVLSQRCKDFPLNVAAAQFQSQQANNIQLANTQKETDEEKADSNAQGNLLPKPPTVEGMPTLTIRIEKIGMKDAPQYIDPFFYVTVKDSNGQNLSTPQETPVSTKKDSSCIYYHMDVHIQKWIDSLPPGFAIFFEFKHYKPKKKITSTKCWACMEKDEIHEGDIVLELYKKPTDYRRKNIKLFTVKPLYLHLKLIYNN